MTQKNYNAEEETEELIRVGKLPKPLRLAAMLEKTMQGPLHGKAADCLREMYEALQCYEAQPQQEPAYRAVKTFHEGKPIYVTQPQQEPVAWLHTKIDGVVVPHRPADLDRHPERWEALYKTPSPCPTCEALARTVMMDQTGRDV